MCQLDNWCCRKIRRFLKNTGIFEERFLSVTNLIKFVFGSGSASNRSGSAKLVPSFLARNWTQRYDTKKEVSTCPLLGTSRTSGRKYSWNNFCRSAPTFLQRACFSSSDRSLWTVCSTISLRFEAQFCKKFRHTKFLIFAKGCESNFCIFSRKKAKIWRNSAKICLISGFAKKYKKEN